jgi:hypothetical protein
MYGGTQRNKSIGNDQTIMNQTANITGFFSTGQGNTTAISGARKPTADSTAQAMFINKNNRTKFSNGGGSVGRPLDRNLEGGFTGINGKLISINRQ